MMKFQSAALLALFLATFCIRARAFWLTDGGVLQRRAQQILGQGIEEISLAASQAQKLATSTGQPSPSKISEAQLEEVSNSTKGGNAAPAAPIESSWLPLTEAGGPTTIAKSGGPPQATPVQVDKNIGLCQCDSAWLQNQTSVVLNKWLGSPNFANQVRALVGQASGLQQQSLGSGSNPGPRGVQNSNRTGLAWNKWPSSGGSGARRNERHSFASKSTLAHHQRVSGAAPVAPTKWQSNKSQLPTAASAGATQTVKVVQGERGPKGDTGERGPSGLMSVKDRDALFDLAPASLSDGPAGKSVAPRLVFVESEQLLVIETSGPSWRPIPLLAPLHDFRKTIAKFSLNSPEERRRLLQVDGPREDSALAQPRDGFSKVNLGGDQRPLGGTNSIMSAIDAAVGRLAGNGPSERAYEEDEDEEEDEEDNDDEEDDLNMEDEEEDDDDEDNAGEDPDENEASNQILSGSAPGKGSASSMMTNKIADPKPATTKRARSQVSSRSAVSHEAQGEPDNLIRAGGISAAASASAYPDDEPRVEEEPRDVMRLRLVALNEPFSGNQHGLRGANFECKRNAARAGIKGAFRALLATNYQNLNEIVRYNSHVQKYPIVNLRGETLASSWHDLFRSPARAANPLSRIQSFDGRHVASDPNWPNKLVWLGTGSKFGHRESSSSHNCDSWHSDSLNKMGFATPLHSPKGYHHRHHSNMKRSQRRRFANNDQDDDELIQSHGHSNSSLVFDFIEKYPCRMPLIVLCIETVAQAD